MNLFRGSNWAIVSKPIVLDLHFAYVIDENRRATHACIVVTESVVVDECAILEKCVLNWGI